MEVFVNAGDFLDDSPLPPADLYVLGNVLHTLSDQQVEKLFEKMRKTLSKSNAS